MNHRSQLLTIYRTFAAMVRTQFFATIKIFRSDSGGEYTSHAFCSFLSSDGTLPQLSFPGSHAQNGVVECKHRHLLETIHAILLGSFIPPHFWADAISTAVYLINMQPSSLLHDRSPGECMYGSPPHYDHLRVFGCCCYVLLPPWRTPNLLLSFLFVYFLAIVLSIKVIIVMIRLFGECASLVMSLLISQLPSMHRHIHWDTISFYLSFLPFPWFSLWGVFILRFPFLGLYIFDCAICTKSFFF